MFAKREIRGQFYVAEDFPTEILLVYVYFLTESGLSTELGISWGSENFGEHVPGVHQCPGEPGNPRKQPYAFDSILEAFHGGCQGWVGEFFRNFCKHMQDRNDSHGIFRGDDVAKEIGLRIPICRHPMTIFRESDEDR